MDEQSRVPAVALGRQETMPRGNMSGIALELLFQPLIEKTELKRRLYGQLVRRASAYCLTLLGMVSDWRDVEIDLDWPDVLPNDDLAMAQTAQTLQAIGYSQSTLIEMTGGDPDQEQERKQEEQQAQVVAFSQGKGMPPMPTQMMNDTGQPPEAASAPSQGQTGASGAPQGNPATLNHPKMQQARAQAKANGPAMRQMMRGGQ